MPADYCPACGHIAADCLCRPQWMARTPLRQPRAFGSLVHAAGNSSSGQPPVRGRAWAGGLALLLVFLVGCASSPAYKTLYAVGHTVDASVQTYMNLVVDGKVRTNDVPMVSRVYQDFQIAYRLALAGAQFNANAPPDTNLTARVGVVLGVVAAAQGAAR